MTLSHEMRVDREKLRKNCAFTLCRSNPFAQNETRSAKTEEKLRFYLPSKGDDPPSELVRKIATTWGLPCETQEWDPEVSVRIGAQPVRGLELLGLFLCTERTLQGLNHDNQLRQ